MASAAALILSVPMLAQAQLEAVRSEPQTETPSLGAETIGFSIPTQDLASALMAYASQAGVQIVMPSDFAAEQTSPEISGQYDRAEALNQLLAGSKLSYVLSSDNTITIVQADAEPAVANAASSTDEAATTAVEPEPAEIEEIVVTAQRKKERLQDVPIAVNVLSSDALESMGVIDTSSLQAVVPGLDFSRSGAAGTPYLRGVGSNAGNPNDEPSVAMYVDGVYIAAPFANYTNFNNIQRVEVLKGPQGTLFGRNATGGVIQIVTKDPQQAPSGSISFGYDNYRTPTGSIYLTSGLSENLAADFAFQADDQGKGWGTNQRLDLDTHKSRNMGARSKLLYTPNEKTSATFAADYNFSEGSVVDYRLADGVPGAPRGKYDSVTDELLGNIHDNNQRVEQGGASLHVNHDMEWSQLVSITSGRRATGVLQFDTDATPEQILDANLALSQYNYSQELQLLSPVDSSIDWIVGLFLFQNIAGYDPGELEGSGIGGINLKVDAEQRTRSGSLYGQATYPLAENTKLTGGLRFTKESQRFESSTEVNDGGAGDAPTLKQTFNKPTWRLALDRAFTNDLHAYVSYNRGVKSGGFDLLNPGGPGYKPEQLDAYEAGVKTQFLDRRVRFNASAFYYDYKDIQLQTNQTGTVRTTNAAGAHIKGLDADMQWLASTGLTLSAGLALLDGEYTNLTDTPSYTPTGVQSFIDASGQDTIRTPKLSGSLGADYLVPGKTGNYRYAITYIYNDGFFYFADNRLKQDAYSLVNASIGWTTTDDRFGATLWGRNLANNYYYQSAVSSSYGDLIVPAAPRTVGVSFTARF